MRSPKPLLIIIILSFFSPYIFAQEILEKLAEIAIIDQKVMMPMRDGVRLATDIYRPQSDQKVPIIFSRTPYNFNSWGDGEIRTRTYERAYEAVKRGFAYVVQNARGRFFSEGDWDILGTPLTDGFDAIAWMSEQPWSNGKVGTLGCSSTAEWQMAIAALDHPSHAAMVPQGFGAGVGRVGNYYEQGNWYRGGVEQLLFFSWLYRTQHDELKPTLPDGISQSDLQRLQRFYDMAPEYPLVDWTEGFKHLPLQDIIKAQEGPVGVFEKMVRRKPNDPAWFKGGLYHDDMGFGVPSFWFVSWYDVATSPNLALFNHVRNNIKDREVADNQYLVIAPTLHCRYTRATENTIVGERNVGNAQLDYDGMIYGWFDYWLKGAQNGILKNIPRVQYYTMGSNKWQSSETWPPREAQMTTFYLNSQGNANSLYGDGKLSLDAVEHEQSDSFTYDPNNPVPSYGGGVCCMGNALEGGSFDQQQMETRNDILVYT
ncbi:MAG: CocE/NonD family hydrolase, partial [Cyclobacteriaceae bacterium]